MTQRPLTKRFDPAEYLYDEESRAEYLRLSEREGEEAFAQALPVVERSREINAVRNKTHGSKEKPHEI